MGAVFQPGALVLDPTSLPRRLGAHHGPADLHHPGLASTPGHLVSHCGRRAGTSRCCLHTLGLRGSASVSSSQPDTSQGPSPPPRNYCSLRIAAAPQTLSSAHHPNRAAAAGEAQEGAILSCLPANLRLKDRATGEPALVKI